MKWSWKFIRVAGIDIYVHSTFLILVAWIGLHFWQAEGTLTAVLSGIGFILALFTCVVLHELGHSLTARRYGILTRSITLLPIGGIAALERMPDDPRQEIVVALAGPAVNLLIAFLLWSWISMSGGFVPLEELYSSDESFLGRLVAINVMLAVFNMLPALPMDGGRVLRATLAMRMNAAAATEVAARVGQGLALGLGFLGLLYNPFLIFIALFVWIGAAAEAQLAQMKSALAGMTVGHAMLTDYATLSPDEPLVRAVERTLAGSQKDFPVLADGNVVGVLTHSDLLRGLQAQGQQASVGDWMQRQVECADVNEPLQDVLQRLENSPCRMLTATKAGSTVGIVSLDNFVELFRIQAAIQARLPGRIPRSTNRPS
ncbi:MAG: site-2 protease family protein [Gammaproteobacteria bacterium]|nr:site-2 protease family protein [Gammaproteobacteria bacterium]